MELTNDTAHRALLFVSSVQQQGYSPTVEEFTAYIIRPFP